MTIMKGNMMAAPKAPPLDGVDSSSVVSTLPVVGTIVDPSAIGATTTPSVGPIPDTTPAPHAAAATGGGPLVLHGLAGLQERVGTDLGVSGWRTVTQEDVTTFARLTGDEQWIHVDPERARNGPFGGTIQHGFLTLGLATGLLWEVCVIDGFAVVINYGLNKVRFPAPLRVGSRVRMQVHLLDVGVIGPAGDCAEAVYRLVYEVEGETKPCCVADLVFRYNH